ncbi:MAG: hypothetical protein A2787_08730 [Omnitrophica WOR_2 bacterium RIFCSPHIGHO2_01_FULL_48_9]|nr:MAG: hypothetical protein A3D10_02620 [Omnitrophica WOR_2 bacterium RIFCSPHIGHO2_02_FULL_48_11]OGX34278.1 MAG: hypothetical protein A2787_08730 [Omnitrophica WOR_2 bacterium RIFCSPHIGHO2_01_FULL_48_9]
MEEGERGKEASADVRPYLNKADEPGEAQPACPAGRRISHWAKTGHNLGTTALAVGLHSFLRGNDENDGRKYG